MMPDAGRVSAILAVKDGGAYLREALDSMLGQTPPPFEVIVVDDGSTDDTPQVMASYGDRIRAVRQPNRGQAAAMAAGVALAEGDLLAFNDADDLWTPGKLEKQLAALADPEVEAVFGMTEQFVSPELPPTDQARLAPRVAVLKGEIAQAMLVRRSAFERIGGYDPAVRMAGFTDWLARAKHAGLRSVTVPDIVHRRRLHLTNYSRTDSTERDRNLLATLRRHVRRQT